MAIGRDLTPEEKEKYRQWQMEEILRRRGRPGHPFVEPGDEVKPELKLDVIEYKCPECGRPYPNPGRRRCYTCHPARGKVRTKPEPVAVPVCVADVGNMVEVGENGKPDPIPEIPEYSVPLRNIDVPVPDHPLRSEEMVKPDPIAALRRVVDALDGLDRDAAKWVLQSAARLPRPDNSEPCP